MKRFIKRTSDRHSSLQEGFTIVELMVALSVLSVILLMSTLILMQIGTLYAKGTNEASIQNATRNIVNDIASQLQLSGSKPDLTHLAGGYFCIGATRYSFVPYRQVSNGAPGPNQTYHALWRDTMPSNNCTGLATLNTTTPSANGTEEVPTYMRLTKFTVGPVTGTSNLYDISVSVAYGDDDLLCDTGIGGSCANPTLKLATSAPAGEVRCKGFAGQEYCATAQLSVTVTRRVTQ